MDFKNNPFYLFRASPYDSKTKILELAEEFNLHLDPNKVSNARLILTNPRKRLLAEYSWFPGERKEIIENLINILEKDNIKDLSFLDLPISPLSKTNMLSNLVQRNNVSSENLLIIKQLILNFEKINKAEIQIQINNDRNKSGFNPIKNLSFFDEELNDRRKYFVKRINSAFSNLEIPLYAATLKKLMEDIYRIGDSEYILLAEVIDNYEVISKELVDEEEMNMNISIQEIERFVASPYNPESLKKQISILNDWIVYWDDLVQPIQLSFQKRGLVHTQTRNIALLIRRLAYLLEENHSDLTEVILLNLQNVFKEVVEVADIISKDLKTLSKRKSNKDTNTEKTIYKRKSNKDPNKVKPTSKRTSNKDPNKVRNNFAKNKSFKKIFIIFIVTYLLLSLMKIIKNQINKDNFKDETSEEIYRELKIRGELCKNPKPGTSEALNRNECFYYKNLMKEISDKGLNLPPT